MKSKSILPECNRGWIRRLDFTTKHPSRILTVVKALLAAEQEMAEIVNSTIVRREPKIEPIRWTLENVERYYYIDEQNRKVFTELNYWYCETTTLRKETKRIASTPLGEEHKLPEWAKSITQFKQLQHQ